MTTYTFAAGKNIVSLNDGAVNVFDAVTNDPFFLADYIPNTGGATPPTSRAYPCQIMAAQPGFAFTGGRFYGNIPESTSWNQFYIVDDFNSALVFPRNGITGTFRDMHFGIRDDLDSGYTDGFRTNQAGAITIEDSFWWLSRDDCIEADGDTSNALTVRRCFVENAYVWISATGLQSTRVITVEDTLVRVKKWPQSTGVVENGPVFKVEAANCASFNFTRVTLCIPTTWNETGYNRTRGALARMTCTDCDLLVIGGTLTNSNGLRDAFVAAGWNIIEDGAGTTASDEWDAQKALFLGETAPALYLRPASDVFDGTWAGQDAGTALFSYIDETAADDADYVRSGADPTADAFEVAFSAGNVDPDQPVLVRYRYRRNGPGPINLTVALKEGATTRASWTHTSVIDSFVTAEQTLTPAQRAAITDWADLRLNFSASVP